MAFYEFQCNKKEFSFTYKYKSDKLNHWDPDFYTSFIGTYFNEDGVYFDLLWGFN